MKYSNKVYTRQINLQI